MKILVTGGAGFIGSHTVVELHNAGFEPVIIDNFNNSRITALDGLRAIIGHDVRCYQADCNDVAALEGIFKTENIEGVIHFAAHKAVGESVAQPLSYYYNNLNSTVLLLELMEKYGIENFVFSSSCTVYGEPDALPVTEATPRKAATSPYGNTKQICEDIIRDHVRATPSLKAIALRYFNPIGAHQSAQIGELPLGVPSNLVPFITQTAAGWREKLTIFGNDYNTPDGTNVRDYIHVVDLAKAHVQALRLLQKQTTGQYYDVFNVGTGRGNTVLEVVKAFEKVSGQPLNYEIGARRSGDVEQIFASADKVNNIMEWTAQKTLEESLADAWRWQLTLKK